MHQSSSNRHTHRLAPGVPMYGQQQAAPQMRGIHVPQSVPGNHMPIHHHGTGHDHHAMRALQQQPSHQGRRRRPDLEKDSAPRHSGVYQNPQTTARRSAQLQDEPVDVQQAQPTTSHKDGTTTPSKPAEEVGSLLTRQPVTRPDVVDPTNTPTGQTLHVT